MCMIANLMMMMLLGVRASPCMAGEGILGTEQEIQDRTGQKCSLAAESSFRLEAFRECTAYIYTYIQRHSSICVHLRNLTRS